MTDLVKLLSDQFVRFEAPGASRSDSDFPSLVGLICEFEATLVDPEPGEEGPTVVARAHIDPRGRLDDACLEAREGDEAMQVAIEPGSGLAEAMETWFTDMWDSWDDVSQGTPGELLGECPLSEVRAGDFLWRYGLTVTHVTPTGKNRLGQPLVIFSFEEVRGVEVWPASPRADRHPRL